MTDIEGPFAPGAPLETAVEDVLGVPMRVRTAREVLASFSSIPASSHEPSSTFARFEPATPPGHVDTPIAKLSRAGR